MLPIEIQEYIVILATAQFIIDRNKVWTILHKEILLCNELQRRWNWSRVRLRQETAECTYYMNGKFIKKGSYTHIYACKYKNGKFVKMFWVGNTLEAVMNDPCPPMLRARQSFTFQL